MEWGPRPAKWAARAISDGHVAEYPAGMRPHEILITLEPEVRVEVLEVLTSTRSVRAARIREYWSLPERRALADVLMDLEVDDLARTEAVAILRETAVPPVEDTLSA